MVETLSVFISYSHKDEELRKQLEAHLSDLCESGAIKIWRDRDMLGGDAWDPVIWKHLNEADIILLLLSADFQVSKACRRERDRAIERWKAKECQVTAVILRPCTWHETGLGAMQSLPKDGLPVTDKAWQSRDHAFVDVAEGIRRMVKDRSIQPSVIPEAQTTSDNAESFKRRASLNLPNTGSTLVGRDPELTWLTNAWHSPTTHVASVVAFGGFGKTALAQQWATALCDDPESGVELAFAWSFYSQGTEAGNASSDPFFEAALDWFGYDGPDLTSPWKQGEALAALVRQKRTLLILDGLEPLQHSPLSGEKTGRLKTPAIRALVRGLALSGNGLCLITTRVEVDDLASWKEGHAPVVELQRLSDAAGA